MAKSKQKLSVIELNGQLLKGAIEVKKVLKKYGKIPSLKELKVTLTISEEQGASGNIAFFVGLKHAKKSEYSVTKIYPYEITDPVSSVGTYDHESSDLLNVFGIDPKTITPIASEDDDPTVDTLFDVKPDLLVDEFGEFWSLQTKNLSF